jgi:hypothetical protein
MPEILMVRNLINIAFEINRRVKEEICGVIFGVVEQVTYRLRKYGSRKCICLIVKVTKRL